MTTWTEMTALELGHAIGEGRIDPVALTEHFLMAIDAHPLSDRIYARVTHDRALIEAQDAAARARSGTRRSRLDGVPISWKDLFDSEGVATEAGSALLKDRVPEADAPVLRRATGLGLVCLGKTHMSELAFSGLGLNPVTATPPCVNDADAVAGGSSSGAAASVAHGLAAAAIGSDTGGSVRIPAAWNDLVGLKTTAGRIPLDGVVPLAESFDTVGPLTRDVADSVALFDVLEGRAPSDPYGGRQTIEGLAGRRLGVLKTIVEDDLRDAPRAAYASALDRIRAAGAELVEVEFPPLEGPMSDAGILYTTEAWAIWGDIIASDPGAMFPPIRERFEAGRDQNGALYIRAVRRMHAARDAWADRMAEFDAVLCPTSANLPPRIEELMKQGDYYVRENLMTLRNTRVANLMGLCALTLSTGLPSCGVSLMGRPMGEEGLLTLALGVEAALS